MVRLFRALGLLCLLARAALAETAVSGRVANETGTPIAGARVSFHGHPTRLTAITDPTGTFHITLTAPGGWHVSAEREGHFTLPERLLQFSDGANELNLTLNRLREVVESIDVSAATATVALDSTTAQETLTGNQILNIPYPTTNNLKNAIRVTPGVVQDSRGDLHLNGGSVEQVQYTLDGFNISDPLTGRFDSRLSVEGVQTVEVSSGRMPAELGKGSAGVIAIHTKPGDDRFRYSATNFVPGIENQKGIYIGNWTPRANLSGPLLRGRAWFSNNFDVQYDRFLIRELPRGADSTSSWRFSNLLHNQFNLTPSNILFTTFLTNWWYAPRNGLSPLDPPETTVDRRARQYFVNVRNQRYFGRGALIEAGFGVNRTFGREIPQGRDFYLYTPEGKRGNFFMDARRKASRDQWMANLFAPTMELAGWHQLKGGIDLNRLVYWQDVERTGYEFFRADGSPVRRTEFRGNGLLRRTNFESAVYVQDSWRVRPGLLLELGLRTDWDQIIRNWNISPRLGFAWAPWGLENTKLTGGYAITYDATNLRLFTRPDDQYAVTTYFQRDGVVQRGPAASFFRINNRGLESPRYTNWTLGLEQRLPGSTTVRANYLRKRGARGLTFFNALDPFGAPFAGQIEPIAPYELDGVFYLGNRRRDVYDSLELTARQTIKGQYEWMVSYVRSRAMSNAVVDINADEPVVAASNAGPMPWDTPHRLLSYGYLPTPWKTWAVAYLMEWRSGFPYSWQDENGRVVGDVNAHRFPMFFDLNLHVEKRFVFRGYRWAFRGGFNNIADRLNPSVVMNNINSPQFLSFLGGQRRAMNFRIRWLGRR